MARNIVRILAITLVMAVAATTGCARAARDTSGFAIHKEANVSASYENTWQIVKSVLREQGYKLYTRDKRGAFTAYTDMHRILFMQPSRIKYTVNLTKVSDSETAVTVEAVRQIYGVTLLTEPNWHDRKLKDETAANALLDAVKAKASAPAKTEEAKEAPAGS